LSFWHDAHDQLAVSNATAAAYTYTSGVLGSYRSPSATNPASFRSVCISYGDCFARAMRMSEGCFFKLVDVLRPHLPVGGISPELRVSMGLLYYGGGSYLDVAAVHRVSHSTLYNSVWDFTDAVSSAKNMDITMPIDDPQWRARTAALFQKCGDSPLNNILGAFDGIAIDQEPPTARDVSCVADHMSRKGFFAINTQAMFDANYEFTWVSCRNPGSVHDSTAFAGSDFGAWATAASDSLARELMDGGYCFVGDEVYAASELVAVPWPGRGGLSQWRDAYNFYQSSARIHIELAFGQVVQRMGVLWRPLRMSYDKRPVVIQTAFKLHNFCRRHDSTGMVHVTGPNDGPFDARSLVRDNGAVADASGSRRAWQQSHLRERMTREVEAAGRLRPPVHGML